MRHFILIIALFICNTLLGQEIELLGKYRASFTGGETINFKINDTFCFDGFYCTYGVYGKGKCEIKDGYLYLYFEKVKTKKLFDTTKTAIILSSRSAADICRVNLKATTNSNIPIQFATVEILNSKNYRYYTITDSLGCAEANFTQHDFPLSIKISAIGIITSSTKLDSFGNYSLKLFHRLDSTTDKVLNSGEVYIYEIGNLYDGVIEMRPINSPERFRKYRKVAD